jgi:glycosyltransferase involved in cell wall biosynthesis
VDKYVMFPAQFRAAVRWADVVHICDHSNAMYSSWVGGTPCVVTCHDMLAVRGALGEETDCPASVTGRYLQRWIVRGLRRASVLASVSTATAEDVKKIVGGSAPKQRVILNALNYPYRRISREEAAERLRQAGPLEITRPFVLHVGQNHARKNRAGVIRAFALAASEADLQLVLAGQALSPELQELARAEGVAERVRVVVKPGNEVLEALYNQALALFFPSRFEGFGWPLIEAQACGCPVVCSRCVPFTEVVGASAISRDVDDERGFAEEIVRLARDAGEREAWSAAGLRNAARFDAEQMIARYVDVYGDLARRR